VKRGDKIHIGSILAIILMIAGLIYTYKRKNYLNHSLLLVNTFIFIITIATSDDISVAAWSPYNSLVYKDLAFNLGNLFSGVRIYTIFTSMYIHSNFIHLAFNMLFLIIIGLLLEEKIGTLRYGIIFYISGVAAALTWAGTSGLLRPEVSILGASGGLFGIFGAYARLYPEERFAFFPIPFPMPISTWAFIFVLIALIGTFASDICFFSNIAHMAHIGGLFGGYFMAPYVMRIEAETKKKKVTKVDFEALEQLAITDEQKDMLEKIRFEDEPEVRDAWLEHFLDKAQCPQCDKKLVGKGRTLSCDCGFELKY
jgi:membrane associated rhomboid family serine protease